jgi:hypothetical protein
MNRRTVSLLGALSVLSASSIAAQSGVLVGVATSSGYETLWIVGNASRPVRATIPSLLVPRSDGWWRLGTAGICPTGGPDDQMMHVLWRSRADSTPVVSEFCHELPRGELPLPIYADDSATADSLRKELVRCSWSRIDIKFVSPEYIAIGETSGQTEECEPRGGRWYQTYYVSRFNGDSLLPLSGFAERQIDSMGRVALAQAAKDLARDELCTNVAGHFDAAELVDVGSEWYPARVRGHWTPVVFTQLVTGECQLESVVETSLSRALTGPDSVRIAWTEIAKRVKGLEDAFTSPDGRVVLAHTGDSLLVHLGDGRSLGRRIAAVPFADRKIVMIQWATGRHVKRWNDEIAALVRRGLSEVRVLPPAKEQ